VEPCPLLAFSSCFYLDLTLRTRYSIKEDFFNMKYVNDILFNNRGMYLQSAPVEEVNHHYVYDHPSEFEFSEYVPFT